MSASPPPDAALPRTNWAGNVAFGASRTARPGALAELQAEVAAADRVRALGTGHSFNAIADTDGLLVSVAGLPRVLEVDSRAQVVRVSAGTRFGELTGPLHDAGFALHNLGSLPHISVGGAVATGTHGSGVTNGTLASAVRALELVTADGELRRLSREQDGDRLDGCVIALGALGVVTAVELAVEPTYDVRQHVYDDLPREVLRDRLDEVLAAGYSVSVFDDWGAGAVPQVWRRLRVTADDAGDAPAHWLGATAADGPRHPVPGLSGTICTEQGGVRGPWHARLPYFRLEFTPSSGDELQSEWFVRRQDAPAALQALDGLRDRIAAVLHVGELRTIAAEPLWLSPSAGRDTVAVHFTWVRDLAAVLLVVQAVEECLAPFGARPHWAKLHATSAVSLRERYDRYDDFVALARELDPTGVFRNHLLDRCFPGLAAAPARGRRS